MGFLLAFARLTNSSQQFPRAVPVLAVFRADTAFQPSIGPLLKPHHLELFYYVAKHGGISAASRAMPYGLGQPAISGQIADLERQLNTRLLDRRPFHLHRAGQTLFDYIEKHFDGLPLLEEKLTARPKQSCRIALDDLLGPQFLPALMTVNETFSADVLWEFSAVPPGEPAKLLRERLAHLVITTAEIPGPGIRSLVLGRVVPCLLVSRNSAITSSANFWRQKRDYRASDLPFGSPGPAAQLSARPAGPPGELAGQHSNGYPYEPARPCRGRARRRSQPAPALGDPPLRRPASAAAGL